MVIVRLMTSVSHPACPGRHREDVVVAVVEEKATKGQEARKETAVRAVGSVADLEETVEERHRERGAATHVYSLLVVTISSASHVGPTADWTLQ